MSSSLTDIIKADLCNFRSIQTSVGVITMIIRHKESVVYLHDSGITVAVFHIILKEAAPLRKGKEATEKVGGSLLI